MSNSPMSCGTGCRIGPHGAPRVHLDNYGGWIIAMPTASNSLTRLIDLNTYFWSSMKQLFEAVEFMHEHNIAHLELKSSHLLFPSDYSQRTVIGFGVSIRLRNAEQLLKARVAIAGYIAPGVDEYATFNAIRANFWSIAKFIDELCLLRRLLRSRNGLLALSK